MDIQNEEVTVGIRLRQRKDKGCRKADAEDDEGQAVEREVKEARESSWKSEVVEDYVQMNMHDTCINIYVPCMQVYLYLHLHFISIAPLFVFVCLYQTMVMISSQDRSRSTDLGLLSYSRCSEISRSSCSARPAMLNLHKMMSYQSLMTAVCTIALQYLTITTKVPIKYTCN